MLWTLSKLNDWRLSILNRSSQNPKLSLGILALINIWLSFAQEPKLFVNNSNSYESLSLFLFYIYKEVAGNEDYRMYSASELFVTTNHFGELSTWCVNFPVNLIIIFTVHSTIQRIFKSRDLLTESTEHIHSILTRLLYVRVCKQLNCFKCSIVSIIHFCMEREWSLWKR